MLTGQEYNKCPDTVTIHQYFTTVIYCIQMMLLNNGDFLVRATEPVAGQARHMVLSVMWRQELDDVGVRYSKF